MKQALSIFRFLRDCANRGEAAALVTLTDVSGRAARAPGEHMAVAASGRSIGSFSGGCVEAAVIAEAQDALVEGRARHVRFGEGSRYIDIQLPCGGGIDLLFTPLRDQGPIERAIDGLQRRIPVVVTLTTAGDLTVDCGENGDSTMWNGTAFIVRHEPVLNLIVLGHGAEPRALLDIAGAYGADTVLFSPQASLVEEIRQKGGAADLLRFIGRAPDLSVDRWTAVVALFHDHDWETDLLAQSLEQRPFFVGAMGSARTHAERMNRLLEAGCERRDVERVVGPVGLIRATRDPQTLALSIMAQVVDAYEAAISRPVADQAGGRLNDVHPFDE